MRWWVTFIVLVCNVLLLAFRLDLEAALPGAVGTHSELAGGGNSGQTDPRLLSPGPAKLARRLLALSLWSKASRREIARFPRWRSDRFSDLPREDLGSVWSREGLHPDSLKRVTAEAPAAEEKQAEGQQRKDSKCPLSDLPPPPNRPADLPALIKALQDVGVDSDEEALNEIFQAKPAKTKMEQFFQLLYLIQKRKEDQLPVMVTRPKITEILLAAKVFTDRWFPDKIVSVTLERPDGRDRPRYQVRFDAEEARFPLNGGIGFAVWDHGMCQHAQELVLYDGFSFELKKSGRNLVIDDFDKVEAFGKFGSRIIVDIDINYAAFKRVEFIDGTDQGKVKSRVADREFATNSHSFLFKYVGRLIPDTTRERIDW